MTVSTGSGDGTLGLNLVDDDSITDGVGNKLGGTGTGNGNFTGQVYTIDKTPPTVSSINLADANPTNASTVHFTVTFSESVSGVDSSDFTLAASGVSGASISNVSGSGSSYTVTVSSGSGDGTLGLNLVDDDSITDGVGNKLGGTGTGNGNFTGQVYTINKSGSSVNLVGGPVYYDASVSEVASGQRSMIRRVRITLDQSATFDANALTVTGTYQNNSVGTVTVSLVGGLYDSVNHVYNYDFGFSGTGVEASGSVTDGRYTLTLHASLVHATGGGTLAGGDQTFKFFRLFGDSNGDGKVDDTDLAAFMSAYRSRAGSANYIAYFDYNGDNSVDSTDLYQFQRRYKTKLNDDGTVSPLS